MMFQCNAFISKIFVTAIFVLVAFVPFRSHAVTFNTDIQDHPTILLTNYTKHPGCTTCWSSYITADPGDIISFLVYYHNTSAETASSVRLRVIVPQNGFLSATVTGQVTARDGTGASDSATLLVSSKQVLNFIPGSVRWYPDQTVSPQPPEPLMAGQTGREILTPEGLFIGDLAAGWGNQGHLIFRAQLSNDADASAPTVVTQVVNGGGNYAVSALASVVPNNAETKAWIEWGTSLQESTAPYIVGSGSYPVQFSATFSAARPDTLYRYRAVAENKYGKTYGATFSFRTDSSGRAVISYQQPTARTENAARVSERDAVLAGTAQSNGNATAVWFEWGATPALGIQTPIIHISEEKAEERISHAISGLVAHQTYYYRLVAENPRGTSYGATLKFTTPSVSPAPSESSRSSGGVLHAPASENIPVSKPEGAPAPGQKPALSFAALGAALDPSTASFLFAVILILTAVFFAYRQFFKHAQPL